MHISSFCHFSICEVSELVKETILLLHLAPSDGANLFNSAFFHVFSSFFSLVFGTIKEAQRNSLNLFHPKISKKTELLLPEGTEKLLCLETVRWQENWHPRCSQSLRNIQLKKGEFYIWIYKNICKVPSQKYSKRGLFKLSIHFREISFSKFSLKK